MAKLKAIVSSLDEVPEERRDLYTKSEDGAFRLDAEGVEFEPDLQGLRSTLDKQKRELRELREAKKQLDAYSDVDPDEYRAMKEEREKVDAEKHKAKGDWDAREKALQSKFDEERTKMEAKIAKLTASIEKALVESEAIAAIDRAGGSTTLLLPHVKSRVVVVEEGDEFVAQVVDARGNPQVADTKGNPMSVAQLVESLKGDKEFGAAFRSSGQSGSGAASITSKGGSGDTVSADDPQAIADAAADIVSGKVAIVA